MSPRVLYRDAQGRTGEVALEASTTCYVGRALDCAVRTDDAMVSRKHSLIRMDGGRYLVEDLGSSNGTHVNDIKVSRQALNHNDVVRCGNLWLRYIDEGPSDDTPDPLAGAGVSTKHRTTLGGGATGSVAQPKSPLRPPAPPPPPVAVADPTGVAAVVIRPDGQSPRAAAVIRPDGVGSSGRPIPRRPQSPHAEPIASAAAPNAAQWAADPAAGMPREQLERRLEISHARAHELERGLLTLQAELEAAQQKIKSLLLAVRELTGLEP